MSRYSNVIRDSKTIRTLTPKAMLSVFRYMGTLNMVLNLVKEIEKSKHNVTNLNQQKLSTITPHTPSWLSPSSGRWRGELPWPSSAPSRPPGSCGCPARPCRCCSRPSWSRAWHLVLGTSVGALCRPMANWGAAAALSRAQLPSWNCRLLCSAGNARTIPQQMERMERMKHLWIGFHV